MTDNDIEQLAELMPTAEHAEDLSRPADLTAIVGLEAGSDEYGWQALRETISAHGADAERYRMSLLGDRYLVEVWFAGESHRAMVEWERRLETLEVPRK